MANIKIELSAPIVNGQPVSFKAPCDCTAVTGIKVEYPDGDGTASTVFSFADAHGNELAGIGNLFVAGAMVRVILDTEAHKAYIQNADTNSYLEERFGEKADGVQHKSGAVIQVNDSAHTPLKGLTLFGKTIQDGTPTPTAPVELESVGASGNIGVTVVGKNLLPKASAESKTSSGITLTSNGDGSYSIKGTAEKGVSIFFPLEENCVLTDNIYVHLMNGTTINSNAAFVYQFTDETTDSWAFSQVNRISKPSKSMGKTIKQVGAHVQSGHTVDITFSPMFVLSNKATDFEPY